MKWEFHTSELTLQVEIWICEDDFPLDIPLHMYETLNKSDSAAE